MYRCVHCKKDKQECRCTSAFTTPKGYNNWRCEPPGPLADFIKAARELSLLMPSIYDACEQAKKSIYTAMKVPFSLFEERDISTRYTIPKEYLDDDR